MNEILNTFHPLIKKWFDNKYNNPTDIQRKTWPVIADNENVLVTAPTGTGKTLTAFLWAINQIITGKWERGKLSVLYISPLKALNNDVKNNLTDPLTELEEIFKKNNADFNKLNILTRSGDTPSSERQKMLRKQPEILITTPESLNIILTSKKGVILLNNIKTVILDEIHAVVGKKRGTHLISGIERIRLLSGEFQRIALSATVKNMNKVAEYIGGYQLIKNSNNYSYKKRNVQIIKSNDKKKYNITVKFPSDAREKLNDDSWWPSLINDFKKIIKKNKSTLFFVNSRRLTEKITRLINENEKEILAYSHHGSLSKEIRFAVEEKLKKGELKAIISTNSLELGIDIGDLDEVVMIQAPFSISSGIQRIGRASHKVGETSTGYIFPTHGRDFIDSAVMANSILNEDIEDITPIENPLDVLAQIILSMTCVQKWDIDELFYFIKSIYPYHNLKKKHYDLVLQMLAGKYADTKIRELSVRVFIDKIDNTIEAKKHASFLIYMSGGTISDKGYFNLRLNENKAKIGELDEEFVWERSIGDTFTLGTALWKIVKITHNDVEVIHTNDRLNIIPFWRAFERNRDFYYSQKISKFLEEANSKLDDNFFRSKLINEYFMDNCSAEELINFLKLQKEITNCDLPHRHNIVIEHFDDPYNRDDSKQVIIHTFWGGKLNHPFSMALSELWEEEYNFPLNMLANNDSIILNLPHNFHSHEIFKKINSNNIEKYLRKKLEKTGFFGALFRENAGRALLLPKRSFNKRMPLWLNRLRSRKLLDSIMKYNDFPILLETWRECLQDEFDLINLKMVLDEINDGKIIITETVTKSPSYFSKGVIYKQTNKLMYEDDSPRTGTKSSIDDNLIKEFIVSSNLKPGIPEKIIKQLDEKLKRTAKGYSPSSIEELVAWVIERQLIPADEWEKLKAAMKIDYEFDYEEISSLINNKLVIIKLNSKSENFICAVENIPKILDVFDIKHNDLIFNNVSDKTKEIKSVINKLIKKYKNEAITPIEKLSNFFYSWLLYYGPVNKKKLYKIFNINMDLFNAVLTSLIEDEIIVMDYISSKAKQLEICEIENLEILLRITRRENQPSFKPVDIKKLPLFFAAVQGIVYKDNKLEGMQKCFDMLFGYPCIASLWEEYIFPVRFEQYFTSWMDSILQTSNLIWFGCGNKKISFSFYEDIELFLENINTKSEKLKSLLPDPSGKYSFFDIKKHLDISSEKLAEQLWKLLWDSKISNDSFETIRNGILNKFTADKVENKNINRRSGFNRWKQTRPMTGNWFIINYNENNTDSMEELEITKDRVRVLFSRYGIIFRELTERELPLLKWKNIFKTLRIMELSGEIFSGYFFTNIPGLQFINHETYKILNTSLNEDVIYWMNVCDPASVCGIKIPELKEKLPNRINSNIIVYHGSEVVLVSQKNCRNLNIYVKPGNIYLQEYYLFFKTLLTRSFNPLKKIEIEKINNKSSITSEYKDSLKKFGFKSSYKSLELWKY